MTLLGGIKSSPRSAQVGGLERLGRVQRHLPCRRSWVELPHRVGVGSKAFPWAPKSTGSLGGNGRTQLGRVLWLGKGGFGFHGRCRGLRLFCDSDPNQPMKGGFRPKESALGVSKGGKATQIQGRSPEIGFSSFPSTTFDHLNSGAGEPRGQDDHSRGAGAGDGMAGGGGETSRSRVIRVLPEMGGAPGGGADWREVCGSCCLELLQKQITKIESHLRVGHLFCSTALWI